MDIEDRKRNIDAAFGQFSQTMWVRFTDNFVSTLTMVQCKNNTELWELDVRGRKESVPRKLSSFIFGPSSDVTRHEFRRLLPNTPGIYEFDNMDLMISEATMRLNMLEYW